MSASIAQAIFFGDSDTSLALQTNLFDSIKGLDHPEKGRFGSHFLLFPLLGVNKHLRMEVAQYLYKHVLTCMAPCLEDPKSRGRSRLTLQRWSSEDDSPVEESDPRFLFTHAANRKYKNPTLDLFPASFDATSLQLEVSYKPMKHLSDILSIETAERVKTGRAFSDVPAGFVLASSAAYTHAGQKYQKLNEKIKVSFWCEPRIPDPNNRYTLEAQAATAKLGKQTGNADRWGLRSAVPLPKGSGLKIGHTELLAPKRAWPCTKDPRTFTTKNEIFPGNYKISYTVKLHDEEDYTDEIIGEWHEAIDTDDEDEAALSDSEDESPEAEERRDNRQSERFCHKVAMYNWDRKEDMTPRAGTVKNLVALRVEEVKAPLMRLLKPPVVRRKLKKVSDNEQY